MKYRIRFADWGRRELIAALLSPFRDYRQRLSATLGAVYRDSDIVLMNSARGGLRSVLEVLRKEYPDRDQVVLPEYVCPSVTDTICNMGLDVITAAVDSDLNMNVVATEAVLSNRTLAVVCVHMYGCPASVEDLESVCRGRDIALIDDAAQLGCVACGRPPPGGYGDFGLISFAQSKSLVTGVRGSGGVLLINHERWKPKFLGLQEQLPGSRGRYLQLWHFIGSYLYGHRFGKLFYYAARIKAHLGLPAGGVDFYSLSGISNIEAAVAFAQFQTLKGRMKQQVACVEQYSQQLKDDPYLRVPQSRGSPYLTRVMVELPSAIDIRALRKRLDRAGIGTRLAYPGRDNLLELPSGRRMAVGDVGKVCQTLSSTVQELMESLGTKG